LLAAAAFAEDSETRTRGPWYIEAGGGINHRIKANDEIALASFKNGTSIVLAAGFRLERIAPDSFLRHLRVAAEYSRQHNNLDELWAYPLGGYPTGSFWGAKSGTIGLRDPAIDATIPLLSPGGQTVSEYYSTRFDYPEKARGSIDFESVQFVIYYDVDLGGYSVFVGVSAGVGRSILDNLATPFLDYLAAPTSPIRTTGPLGSLFAPENGSRYDLSYTTNWACALSPRFGISYEITRHWEIVTEARYWNAPNRVRVEAYPELDPNNVTHPNVDGWSLELRLRYSF
jgi:hypothetical protein